MSGVTSVNCYLQLSLIFHIFRVSVTILFCKRGDNAKWILLFFLLPLFISIIFPPPPHFHYFPSSSSSFLLFSLLLNLLLISIVFPRKGQRGQNPTITFEFGLTGLILTSLFSREYNRNEEKVEEEEEEEEEEEGKQ